MSKAIRLPPGSSHVRVPRSFPAVLLIAAMLVTACGCGVRTEPRAPEDTAARAPDTFEAEPRPGGVTISWSRPTKTADGSRLYDLAKFVVERRTGDEPFTTIVTIDVTDQDRIRPQRTFRYRDTVTPGTFEYRVRAVTADGESGIATDPIRVDVTSGGASPTPEPVTGGAGSESPR